MSIDFPILDVGFCMHDLKALLASRRALRLDLGETGVRGARGCLD